MNLKFKIDNLKFVTAWILVALVLCLMGLGGCKDKQAAEKAGEKFAVDKEFERGPLTVHVKVEKESISIADTVRVRLEAAIEEDYEVTMPAVADFLEKENRFGILDYDSLPDKLIDGGKEGEAARRLVSREYRLEPILSGQYKIPPLKFVFKKKKEAAKEDSGAVIGTTDAVIEDAKDKADEEKTYELETEEIPIEVTSLLDKDRADLTINDIKGVAGLPQKASLWWVWLLGGAGAVILAGAVVVIIKKYRRKKQIRIMKAAHEIAYMRLKKLAEEDLIGEGRVKEFYERISNILRWYIEHRFQMRAPERTTEEFLAELGGANVFDGRQKELLKNFLEHCDLVKFAAYGPSKDEIQKTFDHTREFIEATKVAEKQVDVTDQIIREDNKDTQLMTA